MIDFSVFPYEIFSCVIRVACPHLRTGSKTVFSLNKINDYRLLLGSVAGLLVPPLSSPAIKLSMVTFLNVEMGESPFPHFSRKLVTDLSPPFTAPISFVLKDVDGSPPPSPPR